jgi:hypothetical protein
LLEFVSSSIASIATKKADRSQYVGGDAMARMTPNLMLVALSFFTLSTVAVPVSHSAAQGFTATTIELSAQQNPNDNDKKKRNAQPPRGQLRVQQKSIQKQNVQPKANVQQKQNFQQKKEFNVQQNQQNLQGKKQINVQQKNLNVQQNNQVNVQQKKLNLQQKNQINVQQKNLNVQQKIYAGPPKQFTPKHNNVIYQFNMKGSNRAYVNGRHYSIWHGNNNYRVRYGNSWRTFVALGVLAPLLIGAYQYYPYAYIDAPGPYCAGLTEDGCQLVYDEVQTIDGYVYPQCVAYCPWQ